MHCFTAVAMLYFLIVALLQCCNVSLFQCCIVSLLQCCIVAMQARSQKILLGSAFEEKVDLLIMQYSPGAVAEFITVWCMLIAHIHEGLYFTKCAFYLRTCPS